MDSPAGARCPAHPEARAVRRTAIQLLRRLERAERRRRLAVRGSGLSTTALPTANAGATERAASISGALNGAMTPTTPTGIRRVKDSLGWVEGRTWPRG